MTRLGLRAICLSGYVVVLYDQQTVSNPTIATGFVVDDAIVTTENIARYIEAGQTPRAAALAAALLKAIAKAFRVYAKKVPGKKPGDYTVDHTGVVYLMDKRGKFVNAFNLQRPSQQTARELEAYL